jgi:hypothetical protein
VDAGLSDRPPDWNTNLLVLGDFDLDRLDTPLFQGVRVQRALAPAEVYTASKLKSCDNADRRQLRPTYPSNLKASKSNTDPSIPDHKAGCGSVGPASSTLIRE